MESRVERANDTIRLFVILIISVRRIPIITGQSGSSDRIMCNTVLKVVKLPDSSLMTLGSALNSLGP